VTSTLNITSKYLKVVKVTVTTNNQQQ